MSWTDERVELLKRLWGEGLSASQIAARLGGVTRNAVIGKVHRLGLSGRTKPQPQAAQNARRAVGGDTAPRSSTRPSAHGNLALKFQAAPKAAPPPAAQPTPAPLALVAEEADEGDSRATILTLTEQTCKWPVGDPNSADFYFCGKRSEAGVPYCQHHTRIAYQPAQDRRRNRERRIA